MINPVNSQFDKPEQAFTAWIFCFMPDSDESPSVIIEGDTFEEVEGAAKRWNRAKVIVMWNQEQDELCQFELIGRRKWRRYDISFAHK